MGLGGTAFVPAFVLSRAWACVGLWWACDVGPAGLEPATYGLRVRSSTIELEALAFGEKVGEYPVSGALSVPPPVVGGSGW